jgi:hemophore-related protein
VHVRSLLAGVGIAALAVAVPLVVISTASADPSPSSSTTCPRQTVRQEVQQYLAAHPDIAQEIKTLQTLPRDQRAQARQQYLAAHPDAAAQLEEFRQDRFGAWAEVAGAKSAELAKYPAVEAMVEQLGRTPAGRRATAARQYLADHPDARTQLRQLRADVRDHAQTCRATT